MGLVISLTWNAETPYSRGALTPSLPVLSTHKSLERNKEVTGSFTVHTSV